jgi:hypothetical protein
MKLVKLAVMVSVALFAALLVSDKGALASLSCRSIATGSFYSSGVLYPTNPTDPVTGQFIGGYRGSLTTTSLNYSNGIGTLVAQDARGIFQATFTASNVDYIWLSGGVSVGYYEGRGIVGTYTDAVTGEAHSATAAMTSYRNNNYGYGFNYYDFSYSVTSGATAVMKNLPNAIPVTLRVKDDVSGNFVWNGGSCYEFFNESTATGQNADAAGLYLGTHLSKP